MEEKAEQLLRLIAERFEASLDFRGKKDDKYPVYELKIPILPKRHRILIKCAFTESGIIHFHIQWILGIIHDPTTCATILLQNNWGFIPGFFAAAVHIPDDAFFSLQTVWNAAPQLPIGEAAIMLSATFRMAFLIVPQVKFPNGVEIFT